MGFNYEGGPYKTGSVYPIGYRIQLSVERQGDFSTHVGVGIDFVIRHLNTIQIAHDTMVQHTP